LDEIINSGVGKKSNHAILIVCFRLERAPALLEFQRSGEMDFYFQYPFVICVMEA
jgi:hypothetical protein